ncbi:MAG: DPP IV N-terminal domain-containing protein, partial [Pirellulaceae bacterium]|nr:DPP IV N-terminal domain-containing protein [Pirellulaceae bacterium]
DAGALKRLTDRREARPRGGAASPDGRYRALIRDDNVWVRDQTDGQEFPLTQDGTPADTYQARFHWSPDSSRLLTLRTRPAETRTVHLIESAPGDQLQPRLHSLPYAKPGDPIDQSRPVVFDLASRQQIAISDGLFANPWNISRLRWQDDSASFDFLYNERGHQVVRLVRVDVPSGQARAVIDERSETFIDYAHKQFLHYVAGTNEMVWMSERDGWNHLYLVDGATGDVRQQITSGPWVVRGVERVDDQRRQVWFTAGGMDPREDPYHVHLCRVNLDGTGLVRLTAGDGTHDWRFSPDERFLLDTWSRVDQPPVTELRRVSDGSLVCELERADWTALLATGWRPPQRFVANGRDGQTKIHGILIRPSNFDPDRKYPVIEKIYAGPQSAYVPKAFGRHVREHALAELGFIVVQIDGMGTSHRSKAFHDVCWRNLGDSGFPDRIAWLRAAAAEHPELDLRRVGIFGGSAGGQNALRALLAHGDFYHVAVADCGCHDNRMDKIWWNELWMGWPVGPHYEQQSNVTQAHRLSGKLLLIVGEMDRNVDPASTLQVASRLIKAGKDFDLLLMPGVGHGAAETPYGNRRRMDFLVRHLWQVEPRRNPQDAAQ